MYRHIMSIQGFSHRNPPAFPGLIVDSHTHYIEPDLPDRPYAHKAAMAPVTFEEIAAQAAEAGIDRVVQVTASTMGEDNRYSVEGAKALPERIAGVVGRFD